MYERELWNQLTTILNTAVFAVSGCGVPVSKIAIVNGNLAWDECCEGYLFMRIVRTDVVDPFPQAAQTPSICAATLGTLVELGILRCAPMMDDNGNLPSDAVQSAFALEIIIDKSILFHVIRDYNPAWSNYPLAISGWTPMGPEGGCGGGAWQFWINAVLCPCGPYI